MSKQIKTVVLTVMASFLLAGIAFAEKPEPVHTITDDSPAVGEQGKVMLYGVVLEKAPVHQRVNDPQDPRQRLKQTSEQQD